MRYLSKNRFSLRQVVILLTIAFFGIAVISYAASVTIPNTFTGGTTISASEMNANFAAIKTAVDDHDARITSLTTGTVRIFVPVANPSSGSMLELPDGFSTSVAFSVGKPYDYTSGTITLRVLLSGCGGSDMRVTLEASTRVIGLNFNVYRPPTWTTFSMPANPDGLHFYIQDYSAAATVFGDFLEVRFTRDGLDAADSCTASAYVRGLIVEYPRSL